jgi:hypothetical protein
MNVENTPVITACTKLFFEKKWTEVLRGFCYSFCFRNQPAYGTRTAGGPGQPQRKSFPFRGITNVERPGGRSGPENGVGGHEKAQGRLQREDGPGRIGADRDRHFSAALDRGLPQEAATEGG